MGYIVRADQIAGLPAWDTCTDLYEIKATAGGKGTPLANQVRRMLQALLADRFQLKLRHETRNLTVYQLTITKSGSKVKMVATKAEGGTPWRGALIRISACLDYPVMDKTELEGKGFIHNLESVNWAELLEERKQGKPAPSIFHEVETHLGLALKKVTQPSDFLVIEHVERLSEN